MCRKPQNQTCLIAALAAAAVLVTAFSAGADSLFDPTSSRSMFADRKAHAVGDVVTVIITENTVASQDAQSSDQRSLAATASGGSGLFGLLKLVPKASLSGSTDHKGSGATTRDSKLTTVITCDVVGITPAGDLVLKGERSLKVNQDTQMIEFHGIARPEDVQPDNTIASGSVSDAQIDVLGSGPIDRHVRPGILSRIFQFLF